MFTSRTRYGRTTCYWDGVLVANIRLSLFPDKKELCGYDLALTKELMLATAAKHRPVQSCFRDQADAIAECKHLCEEAYGNVQEQEQERPIDRPRDHHRELT